VNFVDTTLLRLSDPQSRAQVFDDASLQQIASAAYDSDTMSIQGPFQPVFDDFRLGYGIPKLSLLEGSWNPVGGVEKIEARFFASGFGNNSASRVDALWRGSIIARTVPDDSRIKEVAIRWPALATIDADIIAALGALPGDPAALETERRTRLIDRIRATFSHPAGLTETILNEVLRKIGATSVSDLLTHYLGTIEGGGVQVRMSPPDNVPPSPKPLPIAAVLLIRDAGFSLADLLAESKVLRERLDSIGLEPPPDRSLKLREPLLVLWLVPATVFDDAGWPGAGGGMAGNAARDARRATAGKWLAREGIGLVAMN